MSRFCPIIGHTVTYLDCQECEDQICRVKSFALLIAGSRNYTDYPELKRICDLLLKNQRDVLIVSGGARGADTLAKRYADERGFLFQEFPADWNKHGKAAGYIRNRQMHDYIARFPNRGCVLFWDGESKGTKQNIPLSEERHTPIRIWNYVTQKFMQNAKEE